MNPALTKTGGVGAELLQTLKHPMVMGTLGGGAAGAGIGAAASEKDKRISGALLGAGAGATLGGLIGALGSGAGMISPEEVSKMILAGSKEARDEIAHLKGTVLKGQNLIAKAQMKTIHSIAGDLADIQRKLQAKHVGAERMRSVKESMKGVEYYKNLFKKISR